VSASKFPNRVLRRFVETVGAELGGEQFNVMLSLSKVPADWAKPETFAKPTLLNRPGCTPPCKPPCAPTTDAAPAAC
jgi:hypothetical protein